MSITYRENHPTRLSVQQMDTNFRYIEDQLYNLTTNTVKYKVYTVLITQTLTSEPYVSVVFENTLGQEVLFTYISVGKYNVSSPAFENEKTAVNLKTNSNEGVLGLSNINIDNIPNYFTIETYDLVSGLLSNDILTNSLLEIRVYNYQQPIGHE